MSTVKVKVQQKEPTLSAQLKPTSVLQPLVYDPTTKQSSIIDNSNIVYDAEENLSLTIDGGTF